MSSVVDLASPVAPALEHAAPKMLSMRNDYVHALHGALLQQFGTETTRAFWAQKPLVLDGRLLDEQALAFHLTQADAWSPAAWTLQVASSVELFLLERGVNPEAFQLQVRRFANQGSFVRIQYLMPWLSPIVLPLFRFGDPYRLLMHGARLVSKHLSPGVDSRIVRCRSADSNSGSLFTSYPGLGSGVFPAWDFAQLTAAELVASPRVFGLPPFSAFEMICDARNAASIPFAAQASLDGDRFVIGATTYGRLQSLSDFLGAAGYEPQRVGLPDAQVVVIENDYVCPIRRRAVLSAGCAYGTGGYLVRMHWKPVRPRLKEIVRHTQAGTDNASPSDDLDSLCRYYVEQVTRTIRVVYYKADDSIAVGGRYVCRGVPARILLECLRIHAREGRTEFSYRELKRVPGLVSHPKNTGFETRLQRLRLSLWTARAGIEIAARGRGSFGLVVHARLELHEVSR